MAMLAGTRIGAYEVIESLGAGGMGEVYRARDTRLDRIVAIKILPDAFARDPDRLARFEREAKMLAALNHPNIASIYGVEEGAGRHALVLELVEGPTLAERIAQGPIPIDEALAIAGQIIDALEAAHEAGVIHRDLKPGNIKVRPDGAVKVLDFGLAKLGADAASSTSILGAMSLSPTISTPAMTGFGMILGTAVYMAPEQARGKAVDKRADIWSFGCVLYEMLAGRRAFDGEDVTETVGAVIHKEPAWNLLPPATPAAVRVVLQRCLEKNPKQRIRDIGDVRLALHGAFDAGPAIAPGVQSVARRAPLWRRALPLAAAAIIGSVVAGLAAWAVLANRDIRTSAPSRFALKLPDSEQLPAAQGTLVAISPDGRTLVYRSRRSGVFRLYRRTLDQLDATPIGDTDAGEGPFFSPDSQWLGFAVGATLKKVPVAGGPAQTLAELPVNPRGGSWGPDGTIVVGLRESGLMRVPAAGGKPVAIATASPGRQVWYPQVIPGGRAVLFTSSENSPDSGELEVLRLDTGERRTLLPGSAGQVLPTGHLIFVRGGALWAAAFDSNQLQVIGTPAPVLEGIRVEGGGAVQFSVADDGTLVYVPGGTGTGAEFRLGWVDRQGHEERLDMPSRAYAYPRLSPDGTRVALDVRDQEGDIWIWEFARRTLTRLTFDPSPDTYPAWTRDGRRLVFFSARDKTLSPFWQAADGTGMPERLATTATPLDQGSFSPDGKRLVMRVIVADTGEDIVMLSLDGDHRVEPLLHSRFRERNAEIAPDGRWIAYQSNESGSDQVYVRPFPAVDGGRWQISTSGGGKPLWARGGRELFYIAPEGGLMSVPLLAGSAFSFGNATRVLDTSPYVLSGAVGRSYDVSADGKRFLLITSADQQTGAQINVVLNWFEELQQKVPLR
jgi:Tol biopolymer transport system component